jgi:anti-anti-sigma regulatory factor
MYRHRGGGDAVVTLNAGSVLDLRCAGPVQRIREFARFHPISRVIIDLGRTLRIEDSGLTILLMLKRCLGSGLCEIRLINSSAAMRDRLALLPADCIID